VQLEFAEGDKTRRRRLARYVAALAVALVFGPSILFRASVSDAPVVRMALVIWFLLLLLIGAAYVARWRSTRARIREAASSQVLIGHGNFAAIAAELGSGDLGSVKQGPQYESRVLLFIATSPPRIEAVPGFGAPEGRLGLSQAARLTIWHTSGRVRTIRVDDNGRHVLIEGRGGLPEWARVAG